VPAASYHGRLNALTAGARNALDVEDRERHTGSIVAAIAAARARMRCRTAVAGCASHA
jgi:hypothetical protein